MVSREKQQIIEVVVIILTDLALAGAEEQTPVGYPSETIARRVLAEHMIRDGLAALLEAAIEELQTTDRPDPKLLAQLRKQLGL